jgi:formate--tetrahydrofolate ligase
VSDIEIAQAATMKPINEIGAALGIDPSNLEPYGHYKAKVSLKYLDSLPVREKRRQPLDWAMLCVSSAKMP